MKHEVGGCGTERTCLNSSARTTSTSHLGRVVGCDVDCIYIAQTKARSGDPETAQTGEDRSGRPLRLWNCAYGYNMLETTLGKQMQSLLGEARLRYRACVGRRAAGSAWHTHMTHVISTILSARCFCSTSQSDIDCCVCICLMQHVLFAGVPWTSANRLCPLAEETQSSPLPYG